MAAVLDFRLESVHLRFGDPKNKESFSGICVVPVLSASQDLGTFHDLG